MPLEDIDGNLLDIDGNILDTDTYTSVVDPVEPGDDTSTSAFSTSFFKANDQVRVIGTTKVMTIGSAKFVMTKYGTYEIAYTVTFMGQTGLVLEKLLEKSI